MTNFSFSRTSIVSPWYSPRIVFSNLNHFVMSSCPFFSFFFSFCTDLPGLRDDSQLDGSVNGGDVGTFFNLNFSRCFRLSLRPPYSYFRWSVWLEPFTYHYRRFCQHLFILRLFQSLLDALLSWSIQTSFSHQLVRRWPSRLRSILQPIFDLVHSMLGTIAGRKWGARRLPPPRC